jgi:peptidoglycan/LPS O-acetylase OafA/YrhL
VQKVLATIPDKTLLHDVRPWIRVGQASYYVYILSAVAVLVGEFSLAPDTPWRHLWVAITPLAIGLAVSFLMVLFVDYRLEEKFSGFWYPKQKELRDNLKQAREDVRTLQANLTVPADREYHASV